MEAETDTTIAMGFFNPHGYGNIWVSESDVGVVEPTDMLPSRLSLIQNYPSPFNPETRISFKLAEKSHVSITIYDMLGRNIKTLINQTQDAGYRSVIWDATNDYGKPVSAGIYLYQIQAGEYISTKKIVMLK